jgi:hypothetical protein
MRVRVWKTVGKMFLGVAATAPLLVPSTSWAVNRANRTVTSATQNVVCTKDGCSGASEDQTSASDRTLGTAITWMPSPDAAWKAAADESKLVFMIQVSGNFARQEFT